MTSFSKHEVKDEGGQCSIPLHPQWLDHFTHCVSKSCSTRARFLTFACIFKLLHMNHIMRTIVDAFNFYLCQKSFLAYYIAKELSQCVSLM